MRRLCKFVIVLLGAVLVSSHELSTLALAQDDGAECASTLERFATEIDNVLATKPRDLNVVLEVLYRYMGTRGCTPDAVLRTMKRSVYFQGMSKNGPKMHVFALFNGSAGTRGVAVSFGLADTGDLILPSALWYPPYP